MEIPRDVSDYQEIDSTALFEQISAGVAAEQLLEQLKQNDTYDSASPVVIEAEQAIARGNDSAWQIALAHTGMAFTRVNEVMRKTVSNGSFDREDLELVALESIFNSAKKYTSYVSDGSAISFSTFSSNRVHWDILKFLWKYQFAIRLPENIRSAMDRRDRFLGWYYQRFGGSLPSAEIVADKLGISKEKVADLAMARLMTREMGSMDSGYSPNIDEPSDASYGRIKQSLTGDEPQQPIDAVPTDKVRNQQIRTLLAASPLSDRELYILIKRFGLDGEPKKTLEELGEQLNISGYYIRKLEAKALVTLRLSPAILKVEVDTVTTKKIRHNFTGKRDKIGNPIYKTTEYVSKRSTPYFA